MSDKTAIVLPIFNQEKYLAKALDSLLAQTCGDWVAFCVNDGSTDATADILADYAGRDVRFVIVTQANAGVATARNVGMEAALARADVANVLFVDPDDFIHPQCLEVCRTFADRFPGEIIEWDIRQMSETDFRAQQFGRAVIGVANGCVCYSIWNKLYPRALLGRVRSCPEARIAQDLAFALELLHRERPSVRHISAVLYYYESNPTSTVHRRLKPSDYDRIAVLIEYIVKVHSDDPSALRWASTDVLPGLLKRFYRDFRRVAPEDLPACRRIFARELASLRARGLLRPDGECLKDIKYYLRFLWMAFRYGRTAT